MAKLGEYYYQIRFNHFNVYVYTSVSENGAIGTKVAEFGDREEARRFVWEKNGWGVPKSPLSKKY